MDLVAISQGSEDVWMRWSARYASDFKRLTGGDSVIHVPSLVTFTSLGDEGGEFLFDWLGKQVLGDPLASCAISCYQAQEQCFRSHPINDSSISGGASLKVDLIFLKVDPVLSYIDLLIFEVMPSEYPGTRFLHLLDVQH